MLCQRALNSHCWPLRKLRRVSAIQKQFLPVSNAYTYSVVLCRVFTISFCINRKIEALRAWLAYLYALHMRATTVRCTCSLTIHTRISSITFSFILVQGNSWVGKWDNFTRNRKRWIVCVGADFWRDKRQKYSKLTDEVVGFLKILFDILVWCVASGYLFVLKSWLLLWIWLAGDIQYAIGTDAGRIDGVTSIAEQ